MSSSARKDDGAHWNAVKEIFDQCLKVRPEERAKLLEEATKNEPELRADVQELLDNHVEESTEIAPIAPAIMDVVERQRFLPFKVGKYLLLEKIGTGGMAEVFLAKVTGASGFEKLLAVKRIVANYALNAEFRQMFEFEAMLCSHLNHPNIVQVHDFIQEEGTYLIVMEYIRGQNVQRIIQKLQSEAKLLPLEQSLYVVNEVCKALDYAHSRKDERTGQSLGIIHRDVSPKNIMVTYDGTVKLLDFGIAKARDRAKLTRTGSLRGTLQYLSPEDANGKPRDHRSDLFSVGVVLYELLSGQHLFTGDNVWAILKELQQTDRTRRLVDELAVDDRIKSLLKRALAENPADRHPDAATLQLEIQQYLNEHFMPLSGKRLAGNLEALFGEEMKQEKSHLRDLELQSPLRSEPLKETSVFSKITRPGWLIVAVVVALSLTVTLALVRTEDSDLTEPRRATTRSTGGKSATSARVEALPPGKCAAIIDSEPSGAGALVNGVMLGNTPITARVDCNQPVSVELEREGYVPLKRKIQIVDQNSEVKFSLIPKDNAVMVRPEAPAK